MESAASSCRDLAPLLTGGYGEFNGIDEYPRVLVIDGMPFSRTRNGGIVKSRLFAGWPKDRLRQITYSSQEAGFDVCERYWRLSRSAVLLGAVGCSPGRRRCEFTQAPAAVEASSAWRISPRWMRWARSPLARQIHEPLSYGIFQMKSILSPALCEWIDAFRPEVIFSFTGHGVILRPVALVAERCQVNVIPYFADDWISPVYRDNVCGAVLRRSVDYWLKRCLAAAPIRLTPNAAIAREYHLRYGGRFEAVHYAEAVRPYSPPPRLPRVRFVFIGSLVPRRWACLQKIGQALDLLGAEGLSSELVIYSYPEDLNSVMRQDLPQSIKVAGTASPLDVAGIQSGANVLVHVESFEAAARASTRLSLSTKLSQYFMAGRCVLAVGPPEVASIQYVGETGAGVTVTDASDGSLDALRNALRLLITDEPLRRRHGERAYRTALDRHDETRQRSWFRTLLCAAAGREPATGGLNHDER